MKKTRLELEIEKGIMVVERGGRRSFEILITLKRLDKVQYIENDSSEKGNMVALTDAHTSSVIFPSLEYLELIDIPELKGWWSVTDSAQDQGGLHQLLERTLTFPKLEKISMDMELVISLAQVFLPGMSSLRHLVVSDKVPYKKRPPVILLSNYLPLLRELSIYNIQMEVVPEEFRGMSSLKSLEIWEGEALEEVPEWIDSLTSLESLYIDDCPKLKSLPHEIRNLSNLKSLSLRGCSWELAERCQEPSGEDWPKIQHIPTIVIKPAKKNEESR